MSTFHPRRLLLATAVASLALPVVAEEHGFLEDASANLNLRNFFFNRNYTNPTKAQGVRRSGPRASSSTPSPALPRAL